jgi:probable F420-dependent oxidoreductase
VAREVLGPDALLAPEQPVVLETDAAKARQTARVHLATYLGLPNYVNNLLRLGLTEDDVANGGSDRLVDSIVAWGDEETIAARVRAHRDAGADHVCVQVLTGDVTAFPRDQWRRLAGVFA